MNSAASDWRMALLDLHLSSGSDGRHPAEDDRCHDWVFLLPGPPPRKALVLGGGWGGLASRLAAQGAQVEVGDPRADIVDLNRNRGEAAGESRIRAATSDAFPPLWASPAGYDLVVVGDWPWATAPGAHTVFRDLTPLLAPGGILVLGVNNPWWPATARARILPRLGRTGIGRILKAAGLEPAGLYAPLPRPGAIPLFFVPVSDRSSLRYFAEALFPLFSAASPEVRRNHRIEYGLARFSVGLLRRLGLVGFLADFMPGYLILARRTGNGS